MNRQPQKRCDDSCVGPECSHFLCHDGEANGTGLRACEECGKPFCMAHLIEHDMSIFLCAECSVADAKVHPITEAKAREIAKHVGQFICLIEWGRNLEGREALATKDCGIIYGRI